MNISFETKFQKFEHFFYGVIVFSAIVLGIETNDHIRENYFYIILIFDILIVILFVLEIILRIEHEHINKRNYFRNDNKFEKANILDFVVIVLNALPFLFYVLEGIVHPIMFFKFLLLFRILRLTRLLELVSHFESQKRIITVLKKSIKSILNVLYLLLLLFYIYAILGNILFSSYDYNHFGNLGLSLLTLFESIAGGWTQIMEDLLSKTDFGHFTALEIYLVVPVYFVSFYIFVFSIVFNIFTGLIVSEVSELKINSESNPSVRNAMTLEEIKLDLDEIKQELITLRNNSIA